MYSEKVMDHFEHQECWGDRRNASGVGTVGMPNAEISCAFTWTLTMTRSSAT